MVDVKSVIDKKSLKDLEYTKSVGNGSNLIEPTIVMIDLVIDKLRNKESYKEIKRSVKTSSGKKLSYGQIKEIHLRMDERIAELSIEKSVEVVES